jgi:hypothetical protein
MIGIAGKTTNNNVFCTFPLDVSGRGSFRPLSHPSEHFLFGCKDREVWGAVLFKTTNYPGRI